MLRAPLDIKLFQDLVSGEDAPGEAVAIPPLGPVILQASPPTTATKPMIGMTKPALFVSPTIIAHFPCKGAGAGPCPTDWPLVSTLMRVTSQLAQFEHS